MSKTQNTLCIVKPEFMANKIRILQLFMSNGFRITHRKRVHFSPEQAAELYKDLEKQDPCFPLKVMSLSSGPAEAVILNKVDAITDLILLMSTPGCSPYLYMGVDPKVHISCSEEAAKNEIRYIFPNVILDVSRRLNFTSICGRSKITGLLSDGIFEAFENKADVPAIYLSNWLFDHSYVFDSDAWCEQ